MDLENDIYKPYIKPNTTPLYIHSQSNHPPNIIKNLPSAINKRLSSTSCNEEEFEKAAPIFNEALQKSAYKYKLKFDPESRKKSKKTNNRRIDVTWFNPPFSQNVKTNVGGKFLNLVKTSFPPDHPLRKICNRNTVKISYRCTPNIGSAISAHNKKLLTPPTPEETKTCNCKEKENCPVNGKCTKTEVIYRATVTEEDGNVNTYTGLTCNTFKKRWNAHTYSFNHPEANQTTLSTHTHTLKDDNVKFGIKWEIIGQAKPFNPVSGICALCTREKFMIAFAPEGATLNKRSEIFSSCRHKQRMLLIPPKKRKPG